MYTIPLFNKVSARWIETIELEGQSYRLSFHYNTRENAWYLSILDKDSVLLLAGIKLVPGYNLLRSFKATPGIPPGQLWIYDVLQDDASGSVDFAQLGSRYSLVYITATELKTLGVN